MKHHDHGLYDTDISLHIITAEDLFIDFYERKNIHRKLTS